MNPVFRRSLSALALSLIAATAGAQEKVVNVYNWADYIAPDTIKNFEKETGIKVRYDNFDSNEALHAKLVAGKSGYDVVVPGSHFAKMQIAAGLLMKLDKSKLPNLKNLDPAIQAQLAKVDPGNEHLVDWLWGYTTVGINADKVKAALGSMPMPDNAWDLVFKPEYASKLKACGITFLDSASEVLPIALKYVGKDPYSNEAADYAAAGDNICAVVGWSGDIMIAKNKSAQAKKPQNLQVLLPKTGGLLFFDTMAIPKDAPNADNAHAFINYILKPEVHASLTNAVFYANPNKASLPFVKPEIAKDKAVFVDEAGLATMIPPGAPEQATRRLVTRTFTNFKANR